MNLRNVFANIRGNYFIIEGEKENSEDEVIFGVDICGKNKIISKCSSKDNTFFFKIRLSEIVKEEYTNNNQVVKPYIQYKNNKYFINSEVNGNYDEGSFINVDNKVYTIKGQEKLSFNEISYDFYPKMKILDTQFINGKFNLEISITLENDKRNMNSYTKLFVLQNRINKKEMIYHMQAKKDKYCVQIDLRNEYEDMLMDNEIILDAYIVISNEKRNIKIPIQLTTQPELQYKYSHYPINNEDYYIFKPYITAHNTIAILIRKYNIKAIADELCVKDDHLYIDGKITSREYNIWNFVDNSSKIVFKKRKRKSPTLKYVDEKTFDIEFLNTYFYINTNIEFFKQENSSEIWDIFIRVENCYNKRIDIPIQSDEIEEKLNEYDIEKIGKFDIYTNSINNGYSINWKK